MQDRVDRLLGAKETPAGSLLVKAYTGSRGLLAFYIMLFHAVMFSTDWNLHGSALMPVFFLLAGYSLAIVYGKPLPEFNVRRYYRNRFARIAPVYYVVVLIALPLAVFGHGWVTQLIKRTGGPDALIGMPVYLLFSSSDCRPCKSWGTSICSVPGGCKASFRMGFLSLSSGCQ